MNVFKYLSWCSTLYQHIELHECATSSAQNLISAAAKADLFSRSSDLHQDNLSSTNSNSSTTSFSRVVTFFLQKLLPLRVVLDLPVFAIRTPFQTVLTYGYLSPAAVTFTVKVVHATYQLRCALNLAPIFFVLHHVAPLVTFPTSELTDNLIKNGFKLMFIMETRSQFY